MTFKIGSNVDYMGYDKRFIGCSGIVVKVCPVIGSLCHVVKMSNGFEQHILTGHLKLNQKNQQLLFDFMNK